MLDGCPSGPGKDRDDWLFQAVTDGRAEYSFADVTSSANGRAATFSVFADALKVDGIRINVSAELEQRIADALGCMLLTAHLADLVWMQRDCTIRPLPRLITSATDAMIKHSQDVDSELAKLSSQPNLVASVGKHWLIDNDLLAHPGRAENYGWHFQGKDWTGPTEYAVSRDQAGQLIKMIQGRGWAHDMHHVDYSQTCVLVARQCLVDGQPADLRDLLQDPALAPLASHQGVLKVLRQPGVPESPPLPTDPA